MTVKPELAVAASVADPWYHENGAIAGKLMVCAVLPIEMVNGCVAVGATPLPTVTTPLNAPDVVGVPEMRPPLRFNPVGNAPLLSV